MFSFSLQYAAIHSRTATRGGELLGRRQEIASSSEATFARQKVSTWILESAGYSKIRQSTCGNQLKGRGDRKDFLDTKRNEQSPATERITRFARRKDLSTKANQEAGQLLFLLCLPELSFLYLDMYFCPHKISEGKV